ncbi:hypothetical protein [Leadbettera azotonutricia]|uniref:Uncharacterized protein n=1 Tax=Leadbettera azotonutricia (strain ATCC BAA-888 / DSM 13862 / ZAS-9) TaxID=545695 RepID=F5Y7B6_LEAAZ|nr:hypothetical protein [Leadbettera azotonutricia]AEF82866.1 conserved hypothetical protein [Leadbettera azotonutricia ZAS-9]
MDTISHTAEIPSEVLNKVQACLDETTAMLEPYIKVLTMPERRLLPKMGSKSLSFVEKAYQYAKGNPEIRPGFLNMDAFTADFSNAHELWKFYNTVKQLAENLNDTELFAGSRAFKSSLMLYHAVQDAVKQDIPGAKVIYEELKARFPGHKQKGVPAETTV